MTKLLQAGDSAYPPAEQTDLPVYAFYAGGQTPHVWSTTEVNALDARWAVPIWVNVNPDGPAEADADLFANMLKAYQWRAGVAVALDTEDQVQGAYIPAFDRQIQAHGYTLLHYESQDVAGPNPPTSGGRWSALWNGVQDLPAGSIAHQYANAAMGGTPWDLSVFSASIPLHELHPNVDPLVPHDQVTAIMPVLQLGDRGWSVRQLQGLLAGALPDRASNLLTDGIFGPYTATILKEWQHLYGVPDTAGVAGPGTWESLLTRS